MTSNCCWTALGVPKADIVGHSLGSIIAQTFAEFWPERTAHVVLISSTGGSPPGPKKPPQFDFAAEIRKLKEPIEADSPFMIAWWDSPTPVDPDFIRRQRKDAAGIPLRVWLAVLDQGLSADGTYAELAGHAAPPQSSHLAHLGRQGSDHGGSRAPDSAQRLAPCQGKSLRRPRPQPLLGGSARSGRRHQRVLEIHPNPHRDRARRRPQGNGDGPRSHPATDTRRRRPARTPAGRSAWQYPRRRAPLQRVP